MLLQYKCENCGDDMAFDAESGALTCPSCGREDNIEIFNDDYIEQTFDETDGVEYHCENCGATVMTDDDTTSTSCSFCGAAVVIGDRLTGKLAPVKVIPFTISKEKARAAFRKWCKRGWFTPADFKFANRIKSMTGMYVPYFIYDLHAKVNLDAIGTRVRTYRRGDYTYTETKYFKVLRDFDLYYDKVPVDASEKMRDDLMDKVEPYAYQDLKPFKTPYLVGYLAEKYDYDAADLFGRIKAKADPYAKSYLQGTLSGYQSITNRNEVIDTKEVNNMYVLFPVWIVSYDYEKQEHTFIMNGQTGKVVGKAPIGKGKMLLWTAGISGISFSIIKLFSFFSGGVWW